MESSKPILVTGATGCIGSVLVKRLSEIGQSVRVVVRNRDRAAHLRSMPNMEIVLGDLSQPDSLRDCAKGCSLVYHFSSGVGTSDPAGRSLSPHGAVVVRGRLFARTTGAASRMSVKVGGLHVRKACDLRASRNDGSYQAECCL
jgi:uncharacterized protein YbjT (DUF2867 family)